MKYHQQTHPVAIVLLLLSLPVVVVVVVVLHCFVSISIRPVIVVVTPVESFSTAPIVVSYSEYVFGASKSSIWHNHYKHHNDVFVVTTQSSSPTTTTLMMISAKQKNTADDNNDDDDDVDDDDTNDNENDDDNDDDEEIDLSNQDWRTFRAKLVMGSATTTTKAVSSSSSSSTTPLQSSSATPPTMDTNTTASTVSTVSSTTNTTTAPENESTNTTTTTSNATAAAAVATTTTTTMAEDFDGIGAIFAADLLATGTTGTSSATMITSTTDSTSTTDVIDPTTDDRSSVSSKIQVQLDPSQWAYDSGTVIEQGAIILGGVEQEFGFGLRQQYFHKAAILVLDHDEHTFTKGIILNRPTDLLLDDTLNPNVKWRVWYGGDVQGLSSTNPEIICLHTLKDSTVTRVSINVMNDIQWTTFDIAKQLVKSQLAKPTDFWVFCGYAGWGSKQLMGELGRKSWYMVATDSQTLLKELARLAANVDPRDAGLETWSLLMTMIGRSETAEEHTGDFDDHMLKEWALKHLLSMQAGGGAEANGSLVGGLVSTKDQQYSSSSSSSPQSRTVSAANPLDRLLKQVSDASISKTVTVGSVVRATAMDRSPFLLECQELHKSLILVIADDENLTMGVLLNRPSTRVIDAKFEPLGSGPSILKLQVGVRYGGQFSVKGSESLLWLHCDPALKEAKIGTPIGNIDGIWKCTKNDMIAVFNSALITPNVFVVVEGVSVWMKGSAGTVPSDRLSRSSHGLQGEIRIGNYEIVPDSKIGPMFDELIRQEMLTEETLNKNLIIADKAWTIAAPDSTKKKNWKAAMNIRIPMGGLGEGYDEEDDTLVYKTDVKVAKLSDDALRSWVATFLLGDPSLGE